MLKKISKSLLSFLSTFCIFTISSNATQEHKPSLFNRYSQTFYQLANEKEKAVLDSILPDIIKEDEENFKFAIEKANHYYCAIYFVQCKKSMDIILRKIKCNPYMISRNSSLTELMTMIIEFRKECIIATHDFAQIVHDLCLLQGLSIEDANFYMMCHATDSSLFDTDA